MILQKLKYSDYDIANPFPKSYTPYLDKLGTGSSKTKN